MKRIVGRLMAWSAGLLLLVASATPAAAAPIPLAGPGCPGTLAGNSSFILTGDLHQGSSSAPCIITGNGTTIDLNGHRIDGLGADNTNGIGIVGGNNVTIKGPGIIDDFGACVVLGRHALVQDVLAYNCGFGGIVLGGFSKCVQCRVHNVRVSEPPGAAIGIIMGDGCLLESSIVESSDNGARVGSNCKVWDLVVDGVIKTGLQVGAGTEVARTVVSHCHNCPGIDYTACGTTGSACQDSSNSVFTPGGTLGIADALTSTGGQVVTDCATNVNGTRYQGTTDQCPNPD